MRTSAFALALLLVLAGSASAGSGLVFRRADGSPIAFPRAVRTWCESDGLHIATLATLKQSRWELHIAKGSVRSGRTLAFSWERPNGVGIFVFDAKTKNEASEGAEGSHGRVLLRRATCARRGRIAIRLTGLIASEFFDDKRIAVSGTYQGNVGPPPR